MKKLKSDELNGNYELIIEKIETRSGIYFLYNKFELVYIGQASNITKRIIQHLDNAKIEFDKVTYSIVPIENLNEVERTLIKSLKPRLNGTNKDDYTELTATTRSHITINPCVLEHHKKKDGTNNVKIRVTYKRRSFFLKTNMWVNEENTMNGRLTDNFDINDANKIAVKIRNAAKFIPLDATFEFVKNKLTSIPY